MRYDEEYSYINKELDKFEKGLAKAKSFEDIRKAFRNAEDLVGTEGFYVPNEDELLSFLNDKRRLAEKKLENNILNRLTKELKRVNSVVDYDAFIEAVREVRFDHLPYLRRDSHSDKRQGEFDTFFPLLEASYALRESRLRRETIKDIKFRVSKAKSDKELEALAQEVGSLQAQSQYVKEYKKVLDDLQAQIEGKYSLLGKGMRYLKRLFSRGRRASQIRTASQMLNQLNKEISDLKREL